MSSNLEELKNQVEAALMNISTKWSTTYNSMRKDVEEELAQILTEEINAMALYEVHVAAGWYGFQKDHTQEWPVDEVTDWLKNNCIGRYYHKPGLCAFENKDDAVKFNLTWC